MHIRFNMAENMKRKKKKRAVLIVLMALVLAVLAVVCVYETELNKLDSNDGVDNSFYDSQFKNKKVMVIVPHEDDDLLISGQVLPSMYKNGADVRVVFATNGDKRVSAYTRQSEACNALEKLGIPREKVIFLGYPDGTQLYVGKKAYSFSSGRDHTYAGKGFKDYHFDRFGTHAKYTAENMVDDIESVVLEYRPDYILAIDFDTHTDHRGVSISFEKAMERILKKESGYTPKVLKCFGYSLAWKSKPDFYALNIKSTVMQDDSEESIKTLAEFSLYGDPSARMKGEPLASKGLFSKDNSKSFTKGVHIPLPNIRRAIKMELTTVNEKIAAAIEEMVYSKYEDFKGIKPKYYKSSKDNDYSAVFKKQGLIGDQLVTVKFEKDGKVKNILESK